jgi:hypothetical protein
MDSDPGPPVRLGDGGFPVNRFEDNHATLAVLGDIEGAAAPGSDNARHSVPAHRCVAVGQRLMTPRIGVLAGGKVIGAAADGKWSRQSASAVVFYAKRAGVASILRQLNPDFGHGQKPFLVL